MNWLQPPAPIRALSTAEANSYRQRLEAAEASGRLPDGGLRNRMDDETGGGVASFPPSII